MKNIICLMLGVLISTGSYAITSPLSPQKLALAQQLAAIDGSKSALEAANQFAIEQLKVSMPEDTPDEFYAYINKNLQVDSTHQQAIRATAAILTEAELKKLLEFYQSPQGKSIAGKMAQISHELARISNQAIEQALIKSIEELEASPVPRQ
ncbi:DUF2059 domain-containing protein [Alkanindiges sp. WGS2144]|uniref:DUF2059 domain-containing protein n=1 Tax=Alkanindiges sp. WGS2144 TaxID=3366808 RepID=UPI00375019C6